MKNYQALASKLQAVSNCIDSNNVEWNAKHRDAIDAVMKSAPSGSGIDQGTTFDVDDNLKDPFRLIFTLSYHHMNENGMYDGWTEHKITVSPSLAHEFTMKITGPDRNEIKEYLHEVYSLWLDQECE